MTHSRGRNHAGGRTARHGRATRRDDEPWWLDLPTDELLDVRFCDLRLSLAGTALEERLNRLGRELQRAGLVYRPYAWLSTDWFTPDGLTGFAIPFYLAHPRLVRLERKMMLEVEGGTTDWCMRLLRHETAHALDNAYRLRRRKGWRDVFGPASTPYTEDYRPAPTTRHFVHNLDSWYSQSHPVEDFAETFAVWLNPGSRWRAKYRGWPALQKLEYVHGLMREIGRHRPPVRTRQFEEELSSLRVTLREHYTEKQHRYEPHMPSPHDRALRRVFSDSATELRSQAASTFLMRCRRVLAQRVASATGQDRYQVEQIVNELVPRCRALNLRVEDVERAQVEVAALLAMLSYGAARGRRRSYSR